MQKLKVLSLFSGIGGLDLGLERAGMEIVAQVEIDPFCRRVLAKHWPHVARFEDVRTFRAGDLAERPDLIAGGDPCQQNSAARQTNFTASPSLGNEFVRVVNEHRPQFVLRENPSHVRRDAPWPWWRFRAELERIGYMVLSFRLRACCLGADHRRDRVFLFAELADAARERLEVPRQRQVSVHGQAPANGQDDHAFNAGRWSPEPELGRVAYGVPARMDRLRGLGNAVVPQVAEWIGRRIIKAIEGAR